MTKTLHSQCRGLALTPGLRTSSHTLKLKIPCAATKTWNSQIKAKKKKKKSKSGLELRSDAQVITTGCRVIFLGRTQVLSIG